MLQKTRIINYTAFYLFTMILLSCATVTFDVERPPEVDLRNVRTITVIPFEWSSSFEYENLSRHATSAIMNGVRRSIQTGTIDFIDPFMLQNVPRRNYWRHVDVFITGRIIGAWVHSTTEIRTDSHGNMGTRRITSNVATVEIEYSYIRSFNNEVLGHFRKIKTGHIMYDRPVINNPHAQGHPPGRPPGRPPNNPHYRNRSRSEWRIVRGTWMEDAAIAVMPRFSADIREELIPWTQTESRRIRGKRDPLTSEARRLVRRDRYIEALELFQDIYADAGGAAAAYNTAILLGASRDYAQALEKLETERIKLRESGKKVPRYIRNEISAMRDYLEWFKILEELRAVRTETTAEIHAPLPPSNTREIAGSVNLALAMIYALEGPISSLDDDAVFRRVTAFTFTDGEGQWSMEIPRTAPQMVWLLAKDSADRYYITRTAVNSAGAITLDISEMQQLE